MITSNHKNQVRDFIQLLFEPSESFYTKTGHGNFQYNEVLPDGETRLRKTFLNNSTDFINFEKSRTRNIEITFYNGIDYLNEYSQCNDGGVFFVGAINPEYPLKDYCYTTRDIVAEMDHGTTEEQWAKIRRLEQNTGLTITVVSSGNKSLHVHLATELPIPYERNIYYRRLLVLLLDSDPAVARHHQPVRLPGFFRKEKGNYQELLQLGARIDEESLRVGLKQAFEGQFLVFPDLIPDDWWSFLRKSDNLQADLAMGYEQWKESRQKEEEERHQRWLDYKSKIDINHEFDTRELILSALDAIPRRIPNSGTYEDYRKLACALKNELGEAEAISLMEQHSPSLYCGWNVPQVVRSSTGKHNAGTIFNYAKEFGWSFPKGQYETEEYYYGEKVVSSGEAALNKAKENVRQRESESFLDWTLRTLKGLAKGFRRGFNQYSDCIVEPPDKVIFRPDMPTPKPIDYEGKKPPLIVIPVKYAQYRAKIFAQLIGAGWKLIHDKSFMGEGKTHSIHQLGNQYIYLSQDYRNPPTQQLADDAIPIPSRHNGIYEQNGRLTTNPNWMDKENQPNLVEFSNCLYAKEHNTLRNKGYSIDEDKSLCNHVVCPFHFKCHEERGENYGFLKQKKEALRQIIGTDNGLNGRAFPSQLPSPQGENSFPSQMPLSQGENTFPSQLSLQGENTFPSQMPLSQEENTFPSQVPSPQGENSFPSQMPLSQEENSFPSQIPLPQGENTFPSQLSSSQGENTFPHKRMTLPEKGENTFPSQLSSPEKEENSFPSQVPLPQGENTFPSQMPLPQGENSFPHKRMTLIWDEISQLSFTDSISIFLQDYNNVTAQIYAKLPHIASIILPPLTLLYQLLSGEAYNVYCNFKNEKVPRFLGIDSLELQVLLGKPPQELIDNFEDYCLELINLLSFKAVEPNSITATDNGGKWETNWERDCAATARRIFKKEAFVANKSKIENAPSFWLIPLLQIWCGRLNGTISYKDNLSVITIKKLNEKYADLAQASKSNIVLDTTGDPIFIRQLLGIEDSHCIQVMQENPVLSNLKVLNIELQGMKSLDWSDTCLSRLKIAIEAINKVHGKDNVCVIGPKKYASQLGYSHWWGRDERGQNEFAGKKVVVYLGTPYSNLQEAKDDYRLIFGTDDGFEEFYHNLAHKSQFQGSGRSRVQRYPERQFLQIFIGTGQDFSFLKDYGTEVFDLDMVEVCPEAAPRKHRDFVNALKFSRNLIKLGITVTQKEIARGINCSQGWVSKIFKDAPILKWKDFPRLFQSVFTSNERERNNFDFSELEGLLKELEDNPIKTFRSFLDDYDGDVYQMLFSQKLPIKVKLLLLAIIFPGFNDATWDFFTDFCIPF